MSDYKHNEGKGAIHKNQITEAGYVGKVSSWTCLAG